MSLEVRCLQRLGARVDGQEVGLGGPKQRAVLALLALRANRVVPTDDLVSAVWGEGESPVRRGRTLQVYVANLRAVLDPERDRRIRHESGGYRLVVEPAELDLLRFERLLAQAGTAAEAGRAAEAAELLQHADELWSEQALEDLADADCAAAEVAAVAERRTNAIEDRVGLQLALGHHAEALGELADLVARYPLRERLREQQMLALYRAGRQSEALAAYAALRETLLDELGVDPAPSIRRLHDQVLHHDPALAAPRPLDPRTQRWDNVPVPGTALIGRAVDLRDLVKVIGDRSRRLVTLHGPGGVGKTRLALAAAQESLAERRNGVCVVELASIRSAESVLPAIAQELGVEAPPRRRELAAAVAAVLADRDVLLVLDNFEQVLDAAAELAAVLVRAPDVTALVTSRAVLDVSIETVVTVQPLSDASAVELFLSRATAANPERLHGIDDSAAAAAVCRRLDRLPLAIELAAARLRILTPIELAQRMDNGLALVSAGNRDMSERHQTVRAAIRWSYDLLGASQQRLLQDIAGFANPVTLAALEDVAGTSGDVLADLESLWRHSMVVQRSPSGDGQARFTVLETVREFAKEECEASGRVPEQRRRHAEYVAAVVETAAVGPYVADTPQWLDRLRNIEDDLRAALEWSLTEPPSRPLTVRLVGVLWRYWQLTGLVDEGSRWCERALAACADGPDELRARVLNAAGSMAWRRDDPAAALELHTAARELQRRCGDAAGEAFSLCSLADNSVRAGRCSDAVVFAEEALTLSRRVGHDQLAAAAMLNLANAMWYSGERDEAREHAEQALALLERSGRADRHDLTVLLGNLAEMSAALGDTAQASVRARAALTSAFETESVPLLAQMLVESVEVLLAADRPLPAARYLGALHAYRDATPYTLLSAERGQFDRLWQRAFQAAGPSATAAWTEGRHVTVEEAAEEALALLEGRPTSV